MFLLRRKSLLLLSHHQTNSLYPRIFLLVKTEPQRIQWTHANGYTFIVPRTTGIASLQNLSDHELRIAIGQLSFQHSNQAELLFGVKRLLPSVHCQKCNEAGKWVLTRDCQSFRCNRVSRTPQTLKEQKCSHLIPILDAWRQMLRLDADTLHATSPGARYLTGRLWEYPKPRQQKEPQPPQQTNNQSSLNLEGTNLTKHLAHLFDTYNLPKEVELTMRQMHSRLLELEAREVHLRFSSNHPNLCCSSEKYCYTFPTPHQSIQTSPEGRTTENGNLLGPNRK